MSSFLSRVNRKFVSKVRHHFLPISSNFVFLFFKMAWNRKYANALRVQKVGTSHLYELQISSRCSRFFWFFLKFSESIWSSQPPIGSDPIQSDPNEPQMSSRCSRFFWIFLKFSESIWSSQPPIGSDPIQSDPDELQMLTFPNASECFRMLPNASRCFQMLPNASECTRMLQNASEYFSMLQNAFKCPRMLPNASQCFRML